MKKKLLFFAALSAILMLMIGCMTVSAANIGNFIYTGETVSKYDITNDGKPDEIRLRRTLYDSYKPRPGRYDIFVNGKNCYSVACKYAGYGTAEIINISKKKHFLALQLFHPYDGEAYSYKILYYKNGKLNISADALTNIDKYGGANVSDFSVVGATKGRIKLVMHGELPGIGQNDFTVNYDIKGSKLIKSTKYYPLNYNPGGNPYMEPGENSWYANRSLTAYRSPGSTQKVFTLQNGQMCKVINSKFGKVNWIKVQKGRKIGWIKCPTWNAKYFYEAYFRERD